MRKKPADDRLYHPHHSQNNGYERYPERDRARRPEEYVQGGNSPTRAAALSPSGNPQDLYAKVVKPSEREQNVMQRQPPRDAGTGLDASSSSNASFAMRPDSRRVDDRWQRADVGATQQRDLQPTRDHNHNFSKPSSYDALSHSSNQPRVYRPGERHIDGTPMFGDPSKDSSYRQTTPSTARPNNVPLPVSMRGQYIDDLAATKTPHTQQDLVQARALSEQRKEQRHGQPSYFQYPERMTPQQVSISLLTSCAGGRHNMPPPLQVDLLTMKMVSELRVTWATSVPDLVFLGLSVLDLGPMYTTDRQTDRRRQSQTRIIA